MNDAQKLRAIIKRDKEVCTMLFHHPILKNHNPAKEDVLDFKKNKKVNKFKLDPQRRRIGKMLGAIE